MFGLETLAKHVPLLSLRQHAAETPRFLFSQMTCLLLSSNGLPFADKILKLQEFNFRDLILGNRIRCRTSKQLTMVKKVFGQQAVINSRTESARFKLCISSEENASVFKDP